jgi:hypothetical protein
MPAILKKRAVEFRHKPHAGVRTAPSGCSSPPSTGGMLRTHLNPVNTAEVGTLSGLGALDSAREVFVASSCEACSNFMGSRSARVVVRLAGAMLRDPLVADRSKIRRGGPTEKEDGERQKYHGRANADPQCSRWMHGMILTDRRNADKSQSRLRCTKRHGPAFVFVETTASLCSGAVYAVFHRISAELRRGQD